MLKMSYPSLKLILQQIGKTENHLKRKEESLELQIWPAKANRSMNI